MHQWCNEGIPKLASVGGSAGAPAAAGDAAAGGAPKVEAKKEEKVEEEANVDMGGLFGDDYWGVALENLGRGNWVWTNLLFSAL